ncbi:Exodeoxyribonuclease 7 large subunit [Planctomycetes bacterium Pan216]|uniref:Exodeoxyribonuclease 7 large subunit n=1 Tax=Kolteria novifilia TaxID=2527975 RepID=A0A518AXA8_9BACT|nr:Exodeoxyribonuclease 7 large subunit [Planctomycetes bacterium Pan216]
MSGEVPPLAPGASSSPVPAEVLTVSELTYVIRQQLQATFAELWIEGEVSNFHRAGSGHLYMTLKDEQAQLRAVMWRGESSKLQFDLADGMAVLAFGSIDVYAARGQYQLRIHRLLPKGIGPLELAFRQLRDRLASEGLFDPTKKRPIPTFPKRIALVTSSRGAAIRDFLEVTGRRWQGAEIVVLPVAVQGERAPEEIIRALADVARLDVDLVILIRGGGSLEDLWAFNTESVVRAIAASPVPTVTGIGHEIDVTIADMVADLRALTPSEAAERVFPDAAAFRVGLAAQQDRLLGALRRRLELSRERVARLGASAALSRPLSILESRARDVDDAEAALARGILYRCEDAKQQLARWGQALDALSPLGVLARGYSLASRTTDGTLIKSVKEVAVGEEIDVRVADGVLKSTVKQVETDHEHE